MLRAIGIAASIAAFAFFVALVSVGATRSLMQPPHNEANSQPDNGPNNIANQNKPAETRWQRITNRTFDDPITLYTAVLAVLTAMLVVVAFFQLWLLFGADRTATASANAAKDAANAAIESNKISGAAMVADQRPWISLDVGIAGPLAYTAEGWDAGPRWNIPLQYTLKQMGKTPATNVSVFGEIIPFINLHFREFKDGKPFGLPVQGTDLTKEIEKVCSFPETMADHNMGWGTVMFPSEQAPGTFGMNGNPAFFEAAKGENRGYMGQFLVIMCVTYRSTLDGSKYRTAKAFNLYKKNGTGNLDLSGETVPLNELGFVLTPLSGGSYAR